MAEGQFVQNADGSWSQQIVQTGRKVQEIPGHTALAITDTANKDTGLIDVSNLSGRKYIHVNNTLNQNVSIIVILYDASGASAVGLATQTVNAGFTATITAAQLAQLAEPLQKIKIRASCAVAPTSGSITTTVEGVQA